MDVGSAAKEMAGSGAEIFAYVIDTLLVLGCVLGPFGTVHVNELAFLGAEWLVERCCAVDDRSLTRARPFWSY